VKPRIIFLVGPPGAGKSTIGRMLSSKLGFDFVDTDQIIEERTGADISWIFDVEGEDGFREREHQVLSELVEKTNLVAATGGGIVLRDDNRSLLHRLDAVVYLEAGLKQLVDRTAKDKKRPLLQVDNPEKKISELLAKRKPFYESVADYVVNTDGHSPKSTVQTILNLIK
jgi:shikimate kinase